MLKFLLIATAFSWAIWCAFGASQAGRLPFQVPAELAMLGEFGPALAAIVMLALQRDRAAWSGCYAAW